MLNVLLKKCAFKESKHDILDKKRGIYICVCVFDRIYKSGIYTDFVSSCFKVDRVLPKKYVDT